MAETLIKVRSLSCQAGAQYLLHDINWQIERGDQWVVFGRNGCGKTTLLSIIAGFKNFTDGDLEVFGEHYTAENILTLRQRIGWISSSFFDKYYTSETVLDIVLSGLFGTLGVQFSIPNTATQKAKGLLTELGLYTKIMSPFDMLSKGERQQVLIARAFMTAPELLILDEPGTGLDALARERLLGTIQKLAEAQDTTIIYVTHYPEEILPSFDKCLLLRSGVIYQTGQTGALFTSEIISDFFDYPVQVSRENDRYNFQIAPTALESLLETRGDLPWKK